MGKITQTEAKLKRPDAGKLFGQVPLPAIVDPKLSHLDIRAFAMLAVHVFTGPKSLTYREIAEASCCSERQAQRAIANLIEQRQIAVHKRHNYPNVYALSREVMVAAGKAPCLKCRAPRLKLSLAGWCKRCIAEVEAERVSRFARSA